MSPSFQSLAFVPTPPVVQRSLYRKQEFEELINAHLNPLTRFVRARSKDRSEAEDVVQDTLFSAFRHLAQLRDKAYFKAWLFRIAINEIRQRRRCEGRSPIVWLTDPIDGLEIADIRCVPHAACEQAERDGLLREALAKLPEKYRRVVEMRDLKDLSVMETAERLRLGVAATKTRHLRARALLLRSIRQLVAKRSPAAELDRDCRHISTLGSVC